MNAIKKILMSVAVGVTLLGSMSSASAYGMPVCVDPYTGAYDVVFQGARFPGAACQMLRMGLYGQVVYR